MFLFYVHHEGYDRRPMEINSEIFDEEESAPTTEQFTVVFMTYKRHNLIKDAVAMFKGIRELHQVVILWNDLERDPETVDELKNVKVDESASVVVVRPHANSLNNRLVPYDVIRTECVLQIDDDTRYLTRDQIKHGFRYK